MESHDKNGSGEGGMNALSSAKRRAGITISVMTLMCCTVGFVPTAAAVDAPRTKARPLNLPPAMSSSNAVHSTQSRSLHMYTAVEDDLLRLARDGRRSLASAKDVPNACVSDTQSICYDYRRGRSVIPGTKLIQPDVPGFQREGVTLKRDRVAFHYSF